MCVRFLPAREIAVVDKLVSELGIDLWREPRTELVAACKEEVFPGDMSLLLGQGGIACRGRFGFRREGERRLVVNARSETLLRLPLFAPHTVRGRCLVPVLSFVEWAHDAQGRASRRYHVLSADGGVLSLAGIARRGADGQTEFVVVTRPAAGAVSELHERMPLILAGEARQHWLSQAALTPSLLSGGWTDLQLIPA